MRNRRLDNQAKYLMSFSTRMSKSETHWLSNYLKHVIALIFVGVFLLSPLPLSLCLFSFVPFSFLYLPRHSFNKAEPLNHKSHCCDSSSRRIMAFRFSGNSSLFSSGSLQFAACPFQCFFCLSPII